ncbi:glycosyl hydrolase [Ruegeria arenilitoris]|uniref:glycosyl hydrolase n=1 Tax=Ruegeria arenilitoris TaxID=1173585 RepID=UPI0014811B20|nr:glycosyl hydrolase [Ruegeria arenilitoris]
MKWKIAISTLLLANTAMAGDMTFKLGVQTHMEQGWSVAAVELAQELGATHLRDEIGWATAERQPGVYNFEVADKYMLPMLQKGMVPLIVITDTNPLYDDGDTPHSKEGREGFAAWVSAIFGHYGVENVQIEIGNEFNSSDFISGPFTQDPPAYLAALVRAVRKRLDQDHPDAKIICSGLNTIAIGFYQEFFRKGGLQACDAISVHPYRDNPNTLLTELNRLTTLMQEYGGERPIFVTEFGNWFDDQHDAPDYMIKMVTQMAAAGISEAYWYALLDEPWWPNMGLRTINAENRKPAADSFEFLQNSLLPLGRPVASETIEPARIYEFGQNGEAFVVWGSGGEFEVSGEAKFFDSRGRPIDPVSRMSDAPVLILGQDLDVRLKTLNMHADTQYQFNRPPWSYYARRPSIGLVPLEIIDWNWPSFRGAPDLSPLRITDDGVTTARFNDRPYSAIERFTAQMDGSFEINGWWQAYSQSEKARLSIQHNGTLIHDAEVTEDGYTLPEISLVLQTGDTLDFEIVPTGPEGDASVKRRIKISGPPVSLSSDPDNRL